MSVIECGDDVVKIEHHGDHCHLSVLTSSFTGEAGFHQPAQSAWVAVSWAQAQELIAELQKIQRPSGKFRAVKGLQ